MTGTLSVTRLRCDYLNNPRGIDSDPPLLSWELNSDRRGGRQVAYQIQVASSPNGLTADDPDWWDSGRIASAETAQIPYGGLWLGSREEAHWRVRSWDADGEPSAWSETASWETGLLDASQWQGLWISRPTAPDPPLPGGVNSGLDGLSPLPLLRRSFTVDRPIRRARLHATARGIYVAHLNGAAIGDVALAPGWTDYHARQQVQLSDVTDQLTEGENVLGAELGPGWFSGYIGLWDRSRYYGTEPQLLMQLEIDYADGSRQAVVTDGDWAGIDGPTRYGDLLMGEYHDARLARDGWDRPGFDAGDWLTVTVSGRNRTPLVADRAEPVRALELLTPVDRTVVDDRTVIHDLGQNIAGWARIEVSGPAGSVVTLRFGERLEDGRLYVENLRGARATDTYVLRGDGVEVWEPRFTFHGFQYIEVTGDPEVVATATVSGRFVGSDTPPAGTFRCSDPDIDRLARNITWGQRGNFLSVPTDCPQRDERLGWLGDAQVFVRTATTNMDVAAFFRKWMVDVADAQRPDGAFSDVAPHASLLTGSTPAWADCGVIVPWTIWQVYGDTRIIDEHWAAMERWMAHLERRNPDGLWRHDRGVDYGDWLSIDADTPKELIGSAFWAYDASLMAQMAAATGRDAEAERYRALFDRLTAAFVRAYVADDGEIHGDTQTCYLLALHFGLLPEDRRADAVERLVANIRARDNRLTTGFVSVAYLCPVLSAHGRDDVAYDLLFQDAFPSWIYPIRQGATTIWERWDGWTEHAGFQDVGMNSFNHYSLGSVGEWLYRRVAGIDPTEPGFGRFRVAPAIDDRLDWVEARQHTIRGEIVSRWERTPAGLRLDVTVPANTVAEVVIPTCDGAVVREGDGAVEVADGVIGVAAGDGETVATVGSGDYRFSAGSA